MNDTNQPLSPSPGPVEQPWPIQQPGAQPTFPPAAPPPGVAWPATPQVHAGPPARLQGLNLWLIMPIVGLTALSCGVAGLPFNVVALIFAIMARTMHDRGDLDRARKHLRRAKIFAIVGLVLALANIGLGITAAIMSETSS